LPFATILQAAELLHESGLLEAVAESEGQGTTAPASPQMPDKHTASNS
jgi:hypothetical protein